jgi:hypothetical protein
MDLGMGAQGVGDNDEEEIENADHETGGKTEGCFTAVRGDPERNADQGENEAGYGKGKAFVDLGPTRAAHFGIVSFELIEELLER